MVGEKGKRQPQVTFSEDVLVKDLIFINLKKIKNPFTSQDDSH